MLRLAAVRDAIRATFDRPGRCWFSHGRLGRNFTSSSPCAACDSADRGIAWETNHFRYIEQLKQGGHVKFSRSLLTPGGVNACSQSQRPAGIAYATAVVTFRAHMWRVSLLFGSWPLWLLTSPRSRTPSPSNCRRTVRSVSGPRCLCPTAVQPPWAESAVLRPVPASLDRHHYLPERGRSARSGKPRTHTSLSRSTTSAPWQIPS